MDAGTGANALQSFPGINVASFQFNNPCIGWQLKRHWPCSLNGFAMNQYHPIGMHRISIKYPGRFEQIERIILAQEQEMISE
jgi:hypothetical protein